MSMTKMVSLLATESNSVYANLSFSKFDKCQSSEVAALVIEIVALSSIAKGEISLR